MVPDHDPHPPFIRTTQWEKDKHSQWMAIKSYCSICRKEVRLNFGDFMEKDEKARWEHVDEHSGDRKP